MRENGAKNENRSFLHQSDNQGRRRPQLTGTSGQASARPAQGGEGAGQQDAGAQRSRETQGKGAMEKCSSYPSWPRIRTPHDPRSHIPSHAADHHPPSTGHSSKPSAPRQLTPKAALRSAFYIRLKDCGRSQGSNLNRSCSGSLSTTDRGARRLVKQPRRAGNQEDATTLKSALSKTRPRCASLLWARLTSII